MSPMGWNRYGLAALEDQLGSSVVVELEAGDLEVRIGRALVDSKREDLRVVLNPKLNSRKWSMGYDSDNFGPGMCLYLCLCSGHAHLTMGCRGT